MIGSTTCDGAPTTSTAPARGASASGARSRAFVSLTLQKVESAGGQSYSQIVPKLIGTLTREEGEMLRRLYTEPLSKIATQIDVPQDAA